MIAYSQNRKILPIVSSDLPRDSFYGGCMPKVVVPLTEAQVRNAKRREKNYKLFDGQGLFLEVSRSANAELQLERSIPSR